MTRAAFAARWAATLAAVALAGCTLGPKQNPISLYDFGPVPAAALPSGPLARLRATDVVAPSWLDAPGIAYRLEYDQPQRRAVYRDSRWVASPAALFTQRLRQRLGESPQTGPGPAQDVRLLRIELDEFAQVFSAPTTSRAVVRLRASLLRSPVETPLAQRSFVVERPAASADAAGGVQALGAAADEVLSQVLAWAASQG
jgi:cholesterol transport system auxiliary component